MLLLVSIALVTVVLNQNWVAANRFCSNDPHPPYCADDCSGNSFYLSQDGTRCLQCPTCQPGNELNKLCGNGRNGDAQCVPCEDGFFSANRARRCMQCRACTNTVELKPCERTSDRECGNCLPGYIRSGDRFGDPDACPLRCRDLSPDTPGCEEWWREQNGGETGGVVANEEKPANEAPVQEYDEELCESKPPQCEDDCHGNRLYLGQDGLCKLCLQCQPGYELDKDCGNGVNGDAKCQRCQEGTFSIDGRGPCIPCRICVNTEELSRCEPTSDRECGNCLPGFFQAAKGFFPDPNACPNSCAENPRDTPECLEWWQQQDAVVTDIERLQTNMDPGKVPQPPHDKEEPVVFHAEESQDTKFAKVGSPSIDHTSHMTVITALASLLIVALIGVVLALVALRIYTRRSRRHCKVIDVTKGRLLDSSGNNTPNTATPDMATFRSSPRIYKEPPGQQTASSLTNKPPFWEKIHHSPVQGAVPYLIDQNEEVRTGSRRPNSVHHGTESIQPSHASDRRTRRIEGPLPPWEPKLPSTTRSYDGKEDEVLYSSDGNGTTHSVSENSTEGTRLRRRSSLLIPPTQDGIQVLRKNSIQLNHLANTDTNPSDERRKLSSDGRGRRDSLDTAQKEPEAALFPVDSPDKADGKDQLNEPRDIEQGRNAQSFHDGQTAPHLRDRNINTEVCNAFKTTPNLPHQIEEGPLRKASKINNRKKTPAVGQKQRSQHPQNTSLTITSETPVINISVSTAKVTNMQVGNEYNEHHYGTQDVLLGSDEDDDHTSDGKDDESDEEEDQLLHNT